MNFLRLPAVMAALACAAPAPARDAPLVHCGGYGCGGSGIVMYQYPIDSGSYPMMEFRVGTNDLDIEHYFDVIAPEGWSFAVDDVPMMHACGVHTAHGEMGNGPCRTMTPGSVRWWTDDPAHAVEFFTFGYRHIWPPEDVGWMLTTRREGPPPDWYVFTEFWDAPAGTGVGPMHGPYDSSESCWSNAECEEDHYCFLHVCAVETGVCMPRPSACAEIYNPVCGCDGVTYANACEAAAAGESVDYWGPCLCRADLDEDGEVGFRDLLRVLSNWGACHDCPEDLDGSGDVGFADLLIVLGSWGPCPPGAPSVDGYSNSGCLRGGEWPCPGDDAIVLTVDGTTLHVLHQNATYNCCPDDIVIELVVEGGVLRLTETEILTMGCACVCCYDVEATIEDVPPGTWTVEFCWLDDGGAGERCHVEEIVIP